MAPTHIDVGFDVEKLLNNLGRPSWADVPSRAEGNVYTSDEYEQALEKHHAGDDYRHHVVNTPYCRSYDRYRANGPTSQSWWYFLIWSPSRKKWKFWQWKTALSVAWWLPGGLVIQGVVYPLYAVRVLLLLGSFALSSFVAGWFARLYV